MAYIVSEDRDQMRFGILSDWNMYYTNLRTIKKVDGEMYLMKNF